MTPGSGYAVEAQGISKTFGTYRAVENVSLAAPQGGIFGVLGPNGAGKTTTLRMLLGIVDPDEGSVRLLGHDRPGAVRHRVGYLPEERGLYPSMRARDAIGFMGALRGLSWGEGRQRGAAMMEELGLERVVDGKIRKMSKGMAQMVQLIGSIVHGPDLIVLDEPFSGLDPLNQERLEGLVRREQARGATILFSTHVMAHAERLCDRLVIIAKSQRRFAGTVDEARALLPMQLRYEPRDGAHNAAVASLLPANAQWDGRAWHGAVADSDVEPVLGRLVGAGHGIGSLSLARPGLHDAFVHVVRQVDAGFTGDEPDMATSAEDAA